MISKADSVRTAVDDSRPDSANYHSNALARGLALLEMLATVPNELTLDDFSKRAKLPKSTLVRLLAVLTEMEYVVRMNDQPSYRLGHKVQWIAHSYLSNLDMTVVAGRHLKPLAARQRQTANLGVVDGDQVVHVCVVEPDRPLRFTTAVGTRDHLYCTGLGKLLISELPEAEVASHVPPEPFPRFTDTTISSLDALRADAAKTRSRGFAFDDGERSEGLRCVAVPVRIGDDCLAALSLSGPGGEFTSAVREDYAGDLRRVAEELARDPEFAAAITQVRRSLQPTVSEHG